MFGSQFIDNGSTDSENRFTVLETAIQGLHLLCCNLLISGPTVVYALRRWMIAILSLYFYPSHKWLVSYCCLGKLAHASRCAVMHERFRNY